MNSAHIHLFLNHVPVLGTVFAAILLGFALLKRNNETIRIGLITLILTGLAAIPVYLTGEPAEEIIEKLGGVSESIIEQHESYAKWALATAVLTGAVAFVNLILSFWSDRRATWMVAATFFLAVITGGWMLKTANLGGQIRHPEIVAVSSEKNVSPQHERDDDDDDH